MRISCDIFTFSKQREFNTLGVALYVTGIMISVIFVSFCVVYLRDSGKGAILTTTDDGNKNSLFKW